MTAGSDLNNRALEERLAALCELPGLDLVVENHASRQRRRVADFMESAYAPIPIMHHDEASSTSIADRLLANARVGIESRIVTDTVGALVAIVRHKSCIAKAYHYAVGHAG